MARRRKDTDTDDSTGLGGHCWACVEPEPQARSSHQLACARDGGTEGLRTHLSQYLPKPSRLTEQEHQEQIDNIVGWVGGLMKQWSGFVDETTGAPLAWWQARQQRMAQTQASARVAYGYAPEAYRQKYPYPGTTFPAVAGFVHAQGESAEMLAQQRKGRPAAEDYLREPGEDDIDDTEEALCP